MSQKLEIFEEKMRNEIDSKLNEMIIEESLKILENGTKSTDDSAKIRMDLSKILHNHQT